MPDDGYRWTLVVQTVDGQRPVQLYGQPLGMVEQALLAYLTARGRKSPAPSDVRDEPHVLLVRDP